MSPSYTVESRLLCRCLRVSEAELEAASSYCDMETVRDVTEQTGAGSGCMACHCAIKEFLKHRRAQVAV